MERSKLHPFMTWLTRPTEPYVLGIFRILFGLFMVYTMIDYLRIGLVRNMFVLPTINFQYDFLNWIRPLPEAMMHVILVIMLLCTLAITVGWFFKWACRIFALGYAYIFLLDKSIYNNHIYLFILLAILLSLTNADVTLSVKRKTAKTLWIPYWQVGILQLQIIIVYFYGGIAKLTHDWLVRCQPVRTVLDQMSDHHIWSAWLKNEMGVYLLNYGGLLIDLGAPVFLWIASVRRWAILLFIGFNWLNSRIFSDIGIFPYVMLASLILFYKATDIPFIRRLKVLAPYRSTTHEIETRRVSSKGGIQWNPVWFLYLYFAFQLLFPFRGHFLPNPLDWTTIGNRFSWRMKVDTRSIEELRFSIHSATYDHPVPVEINTFINDHQMLHLAMDPRSIADFARHVKAEAIKYDTKDPRVTAEIKVKYNGRAPGYFVDPVLDMAEVQHDPFTKLKWVYPVPR